MPEGLPPNAVAEGWTGEPGAPGSERVVILSKKGESSQDAFERVSARHPEVHNWKRFDLVDHSEGSEVY